VDITLIGDGELAGMVVAALFTDGGENPEYLLLTVARRGRCALAASGGGVDAHWMEVLDRTERRLSASSLGGNSSGQKGGADLEVVLK
jgi:hypothetical protein